MTLTYYSSFMELFSGCVMYIDGLSITAEIIGNHTLTSSGVAVTAANHRGYANKALAFSSKTASYVSFGDATDMKPTTGLSIVMWVYPTETGTTFISCCNNGNFGGYKLQMMGTIGSPRLEFETSDTTAYSIYSAYGAITGNAWQMITATVLFHSQMYIYKNGVIINSSGSGDSHAHITYGSSNVKLGLYDGMSTNGFVGNMGECMFYNRVLSQAEIVTLYRLTSQRYIYPLFPDGERSVW